MGHYESAEAVQDELGGILRNVLGNEQRLAAVRRTDSIVRFAFSEPDASVTWHVRVAAQPRIEIGESSAKPDLILAMTSDVGRALLLGERSSLSILGGGEIAMKGSVAKLLTVLESLAGASELGAPGSATEESASEPEAEVPAEAEPEAEAEAEPEAQAESSS